MMVLVLVGGLLYTVGAVIYGLKRPNPFPGRFGFHEIFHTLTVLAFLCHWTAMLLIAMHPVVQRRLTPPRAARSARVGVGVGRVVAAPRLLRVQLLGDLGAVAHAADAAHHVEDEQHDDHRDEEGDERSRPPRA